MSTVTTPFDVRVTRHVRATPERVFDAWTSPTSVAQWFAPGEGPMVRIDLDARVGGRFVFTQRRGDADVEHTGQYLVFDRPCRLAFTWKVPRHSADPVRIGIEVRPREDGSDITLTHELTPDWADAGNRTKDSWTKMIDVLATLVE
jgi:uncharacterized protein YndB with AHSA1/START domain